MYFESEQHYNECMAAEAEAESYNNEQCEYNKYLQGLIDNHQYVVFGIEMCLDMLNSKVFKTSGLTHEEFLSFKKEEFLHPKKDIEIGEMPF